VSVCLTLGPLLSLGLYHPFLPLSPSLSLSPALSLRVSVSLPSVICVCMCAVVCMPSHTHVNAIVAKGTERHPFQVLGG
jgi:hypothetical protein